MFHVQPYGETRATTASSGVLDRLRPVVGQPAHCAHGCSTCSMTVKQQHCSKDRGGREMASSFDEGLLVGLLIGEGHFGGDGRQPQVTLRMHERHEALFRWLESTFPGGRLYGPYDHGGRRYYQWMARGAYLREEIVPLLRRALGPSLDRYAHTRFLQMCDRYANRYSNPRRFWTICTAATLRPMRWRFRLMMGRMGS